ncbi:hypothetical protein [Amycolatopsis sp. CA-126428]|uniref:hypothetical protein n=1 Tax=Amycolatopsis sp. CA-126428 TaxID=2073158 RepID=UPI0011B04273|nr:hypothetical protein [Amycolatopsis sp. CA-126428]
MRHDRTGELLDDEDQCEEQPTTAHHCDRGWLDREADHPIPCRVCRPHLAPPQPRKPPPDPEVARAGIAAVRAALAAAKGSAR